MNIKRYIAGSVQEALQRIKKEMGPDAVILRTRTLGPSGREGEESMRVEVTAAIDYEAAGKATGKRGQEVALDSLFRQWESLETEWKDLRETILGAEMGLPMSTDAKVNGVLRAYYAYFKRFGLRPEWSRALLNDCCHGKEGRAAGPGPDPEILQDCLVKVLSRIRVNGGRTGEGPGKVVSFIGPTGVGKTTTLAKMAAMEAVARGRKTALITVDTFRIGAVSQLQTYARIMGIPLEVAASRSELQGAIGKHKGCDSIFIDTAGRSPGKDQDIRDLRDVLEIPEKITNYLVLSATTRYQNLLYAEEKFGVVPYESYIFTKLDEAPDASPMINFLISRHKPVSYFTTGQQVPEDIEAASRKRLASLILSKVKRMVRNSVNEVRTYGSS